MDVHALRAFDGDCLGDALIADPAALGAVRIFVPIGKDDGVAKAQELAIRHGRRVGRRFGIKSHCAAPLRLGGMRHKKKNNKRNGSEKFHARP